MIKQFAVIGLGRFGSSVARTLINMGHEVLAVDQDEELVERAIPEQIATQAIMADSTNIHALRDLGLHDFDGVVIAIGTDLQSSILTALNLLDLNVKNLTAKAMSTEHGKILQHLGVTNVVYPERDMGERLAKSLVQTNIVDALELDPRYSIVEIKPPAPLIGKNLAEAHLRVRYGIYVIAIKHNSEMDIVPDPTRKICAEDILIVIGETKQLRQLIEK